ncbi:MAG: hypothetical protein QW838_02965 [Candidatus Nitrosotenuis sp.]
MTPTPYVLTRKNVIHFPINSQLFVEVFSSSQPELLLFWLSQIPTHVSLSAMKILQNKFKEQCATKKITVDMTCDHAPFILQPQHVLFILDDEELTNFLAVRAYEKQRFAHGFKRMTGIAFGDFLSFLDALELSEEVESLVRNEKEVVA